MQTSFSAADRGSVQVDISVARNYSNSHTRGEPVNVQTLHGQGTSLASILSFALLPYEYSLLYNGLPFILDVI
jgi:hypothetical protein